MKRVVKVRIADTKTRVSVKLKNRKLINWLKQKQKTIKFHEKKRRLLIPRIRIVKPAARIKIAIQRGMMKQPIHKAFVFFINNKNISIWGLLRQFRFFLGSLPNKKLKKKTEKLIFWTFIGWELQSVPIVSKHTNWSSFTKNKVGWNIVLLHHEHSKIEVTTRCESAPIFSISSPVFKLQIVRKLSLLPWKYQQSQQTILIKYYEQKITNAEGFLFLKGTFQVPAMRWFSLRSTVNFKSSASFGYFQVRTHFDIRRSHWQIFDDDDDEEEEEDQVKKFEKTKWNWMCVSVFVGVVVVLFLTVLLVFHKVCQSCGYISIHWICKDIIFIRD